MVDSAMASAVPAPTADPVPAEDAVQTVSPPALAARTRRRRLLMALACAGLLGGGGTVALTAGLPPGRTPTQDRVQDVQQPRSSDPTSRQGDPGGRSGTGTGSRSGGSEFGSTQPRGVATGGSIQPTPTIPVGGIATPSPPQGSESAGTPSHGDKTGDGEDTGKGKGKGNGKGKDRDNEEDPLGPLPTLPAILG
jgi:hypothetical protein